MAIVSGAILKDFFGHDRLQGCLGRDPGQAAGCGLG